MNRREAIAHIVGELDEYMTEWAETSEWATEEDVAAERELDQEALLAIGITHAEIAQARQDVDLGVHTILTQPRWLDETQP